jgi:hypothetical protein
MLYDISNEDFENHVRHATSWSDLAIRCGYEADSYGRIKYYQIKNRMKQKALNMQLDIKHFHGHKQVTDDDFINIVMESTCCFHVVNKMFAINGIWTRRDPIERRIKDLNLDISHWKNVNKNKTYPERRKKIDAFDDEMFTTLLQNSKNWTDFVRKCGFKSCNGITISHLLKRINQLGLNTKHFDGPMKSDHIFVVDSQYRYNNLIKKKLVRDFDRPYECSVCKNEHFTNRDGVLLWRNQEIILELEHKNGINTDNRIDNLTFLCPNCHSQTSTFKGKNSKKHKKVHAWLEDGKIEVVT